MPEITVGHSNKATMMAETFVHKDNARSLRSQLELCKLIHNPDASINEILEGTARHIPGLLTPTSLAPASICASISSPCHCYCDDGIHRSHEKLSETTTRLLLSVDIPIVPSQQEATRCTQSTMTPTSGEAGTIHVYRHIVGEDDKDDNQDVNIEYAKEILQKIAEQLGSVLAFRQAQQERNLFFEQSPDLLCVVDFDGRFRQVNHAWSTVLGWSQEDIVGKYPTDFLHPGDEETQQNCKSDDHSGSTCSTEDSTIIPSCYAMGLGTTGENRYRCKDGSYRWFSWSAVPIPEHRRVLAIGRDITERKQADTALRDSERRLKESQQIAQLGQWELDLTSNYLYWSDEIYRLFQIDREKFGASYEAFLNAIHPDDRDMVNDAYTNSLKTKKPYKIIHRLLFPDGTVRWVTETCRTEYDPNTGNPVHSIGTVQDITELKSAQEELRVAKERAEASDRLKSAFLANMSHEIRTPMNAVIGYTDFILMDSQDDLSDEHRECLKTIHNSGKLLLTLISDILDVSKIEAGQLHLDRKPFSLRETLQTVDGNIRALQSSKDQGNLVEFKTPLLSASADKTFQDVTGIGDCIIGDPARLQQVLNNLLSNAMKFTSEGTVEYSIKLLSKSPSSENMLEFRVADTGVGIPLEKQQEIFQPFHQVHPSRDTHELGGTGLGLTISRRLVEMMGGKIWVESGGHNRGGSVFYFTVPYHPTSPGIVKQAKPHALNTTTRRLPSSSSSNLSSGSGKVLVVDDNKVNLKLAKRLVTRQGYDVDTAENGKDAIAAFQSDPTIQLILMDKEMPIMDGLDAVRVIRRIEKEENRETRIPVVALTAAAMNGDKEECLEAGCDEYLTKPIIRKALTKVLTTYIGDGKPISWSLRSMVNFFFEFARQGTT